MSHAVNSKPLTGGRKNSLSNRITVIGTHVFLRINNLNYRRPQLNNEETSVSKKHLSGGYPQTESQKTEVSLPSKWKPHTRWDSVLIADNLKSN